MRNVDIRYINAITFYFSMCRISTFYLRALLFYKMFLFLLSLFFCFSLLSNMNANARECLYARMLEDVDSRKRQFSIHNISP